MKYRDSCGEVHRQFYGRSDKANAFDNQNADFQEGYAWGIETLAYDPGKVLHAELQLRGEFTLGAQGFTEFRRGFWAARSQMIAAGIKKPRKPGNQFD